MAKPKARPTTRAARKLAPTPAVDATATAIATVTPNNVVSMFERAARDKSIDADKLEKLIGLQERIMRLNAEAAFNRAFQAMSAELPVIRRDGAVLNKQGQVQSRYSKYETLNEILKPIERKYGFSRSFRTSYPAPGLVNVKGVLRHEEGHSEVSEFQGPAEDSGNKNKIQALGSTNSYGRRYTTIDLLNITCEGVDDDGRGGAGSRRRESKAAGKVHVPEVLDPAPPAEEPPAARHPHENYPITEPQRKRIFALLKAHNRTQEEFRVWLLRTYKIEHTTDIKRHQYDDLCSAIEASGPLR